MEIQQGDSPLSLRKKLEEKYGSPIRARWTQFNGEGYELFETKDVADVKNIWELFVNSPSWLDAVRPDDFVQGMSSPSLPPLTFKFVLNSADGERLVNFEISPDAKTAFCYVDGDVRCAFYISENQEAIRGFTQRNKDNKIDRKQNKDTENGKQLGTAEQE